jgi:bisphosphoglycerate-independent phosphoglycerate mutase (AlkP superfamily)
MKVVMILIDGFGVPPENWRNSVYSEYTSPSFISLFEKHSIPVDATMGVSGIPQSATGQTAIFTGIKTSEILKKHIPAFPGKTLKDWIIKQNIFKALIAEGKKALFSNAYVRYTPEILEQKGYASVTTVMARHTLKKFLNANDLSANKAIFHDITRKSLQNLEHIPDKPPVIQPEEAAEHLSELAINNDFTLFEYFLTDHAGHKRNFNALQECLQDFSRFFIKLIQLAENNFSVILISDHGNCENMKVSGHTVNPVPLFVYGELAEKNYKQIKSINEIYGFLKNI